MNSETSTNTTDISINNTNLIDIPNDINLNNVISLDDNLVPFPVDDDLPPIQFNLVPLVSFDDDLPPLSLLPLTMSRQVSVMNHGFGLQSSLGRQVSVINRYGNQDSRMDILRRALREIIKYMEQLRLNGSNINISIITFDDTPTVYTDIDLSEEQINDFLVNNIKVIKCTDFFDKMVLLPDGSTNFISALKAIQILQKSVLDKTQSIFLSDGEHCGNQSDILTNEQYDKLVDYSIGVGSDETSYDSVILDYISENPVITGCSKSIIENAIISSIFSGINMSATNVKIKVFFSQIETTQIVSNLVSCYILNNNILQIKLIQDSETVNTHAIFCIDKSGSMAGQINYTNPNYINNSTSSTIIDIDDIDELPESLFHGIDDIDFDNISDDIKELKRSDELYYLLALESFNSDVFISISYTNKLGIECNEIFKVINRDTIDDTTELLIIENIKLSKLIEKVIETNSELKKTYIHELYNYISNQMYLQLIESINTNIEDTNINLIKFNTFINTIKRLYASTRTIADNMYDELQTLSIPELTRGITTQQCRSLTYTQSSTYTDTDSDINLCCVCMNESRKVIFNCGHLATCVDCSKKTLFGVNSFDNIFSTIVPFSMQPDNQKHACPICRAEITSLTELNIENDYKCTSDGCMTKATVISIDCTHPSYCSSCWNSNLRKRKNGDITDIKCYCNTTIKRICEPKFA